VTAIVSLTFSLKKIVSIILLSTVLLSRNIAFAQTSTLSNVQSKVTQTVAANKAKLKAALLCNYGHP